MNTRRLAAMTMAAFFLSACGVEGDAQLPPGEESLGQLSGALTVDGTPQAANWLYRDYIGHYLETEQVSAGSFSVTFEGGAVPVAAISPTIPAAFLQTAVVELRDLPKYNNPNVRLSPRRFFVRFLTSDKQTYTTDDYFSRTSVVDASVPNAQQRFDSGYDPVTQKASVRRAFASDTRGVDFQLVAQPDGTFKAAIRVAYISSTWSDWARHTPNVSLQ
jgi:hypothetical protein